MNTHWRSNPTLGPYAHSVEILTPADAAVYEKYNAVLRFFSGTSMYELRAEIPFLQTKCESLGLGKWIDDADGAVHWKWQNNYATTIQSATACQPSTVAPY